MPKRTTRPPERTERPLNKDFAQWRREAARADMSLEGVKILKAVGKVTRQAFLEMLLEMEGKYPGKGWRQAMDDLEGFYCERGLSLKERPFFGIGKDEVAATLGDIPF